MTQKAQPSHEDRVRLKAYEIWLNEGKPEGRDQRHWAMAREMIGYDDAHRSTLVPATGSDARPAKEASFNSNGGAEAQSDAGQSKPAPLRAAKSTAKSSAKPAAKPRSPRKPV